MVDFICMDFPEQWGAWQKRKIPPWFDPVTSSRIRSSNFRTALEAYQACLTTRLPDWDIEACFKLLDESFIYFLLIGLWNTY